MTGERHDDAGDADEQRDDRAHSPETDPMTDPQNAESAADQTSESAADQTSESTDGGTDERVERVKRYLNYALLFGLVLLAFVAAVQFYVNTSSAINRWVAYEYRSLFQAAFNLVVLLLVGAGLTVQVRRLSGE